MKPTSLRGAAIAAMLVVLFCAFTANKQKHMVAGSTHYYFYSADGNTFITFSTTLSEEARLEEQYQVLVDQDPFGGTLLEKGYTNNTFPHQQWPAVFLYGHF